MKNRTLQTPGGIPAREDWHKEYAGIITALDFNTGGPNPYGIENQISAWRFNESNKKLSVRMGTTDHLEDGEE